MGSLYWCTGWFQVQNGFIILVYWLVSGTEWVDPEDPTVIAENELLGAAAAIEAAAKKLEQLRPRTKPKVTPPSSSSGSSYNTPTLRHHTPYAHQSR